MFKTQADQILGHLTPKLLEFLSDIGPLQMPHLI